LFGGADFFDFVSEPSGFAAADPNSDEDVRVSVVAARFNTRNLLRDKRAEFAIVFG